VIFHSKINFDPVPAEMSTTSIIISVVSKGAKNIG
jgi:hypothetical protein